MTATNSKIEDFRSKTMENYIVNCLEKHGESAKKCLSQALQHFLNNPFDKSYKMEVPYCEDRDFWTALRVCSTKKDFKIYVRPSGLGKRKKIKFFSEWSQGEYSPKYYHIKYKNLSKWINFEFNE